MNKKRTFFGLCILIPFILFLIGAGSAQAEKKETKVAGETTITGIVVEENLKDGKVISVYIQTDNKERYSVQRKGGKELLKHISERVEVTGTIKEKKGKKLIKVSGYKVLE